MQTAQVYALPLVYQDLRPADNLYQVLESLKMLEDVANDIFARVEARVRPGTASGTAPTALTRACAGQRREVPDIWPFAGTKSAMQWRRGALTAACSVFRPPKPG